MNRARRPFELGQAGSELTQRQKEKQMAVYVPLDVYRKIRFRAAQEGVSMSAILREEMIRIIKDWIDPDTGEAA